MKGHLKGKIRTGGKGGGDLFLTFMMRPGFLCIVVTSTSTSSSSFSIRCVVLVEILPNFEIKLSSRGIGWYDWMILFSSISMSRYLESSKGSVDDIEAVGYGTVRSRVL